MLAIDDSVFSKEQAHVLCIGVISRGLVKQPFIEKIVKFYVVRDGIDASDKIIERSSGANLILINGIALGGLNIVDIKKIYKKTKVPVVTVSKRLVKRNIVDAIYSTKNKAPHLRALKNAGELSEYKHLSFHCVGVKKGEVERLVDSFGGYPEPLRVAHLIATACVRGESYGKA